MVDIVSCICSIFLLDVGALHPVVTVLGYITRLVTVQWYITSMTFQPSNLTFLVTDLSLHNAVWVVLLAL